MNILILGGTGYLGSNLINTLINNKHNNIICLKRRISSLKRIDNLNSQRLIFWDIDNIDKELLDNKIKIDCMINTACKYMKNDVTDRDIIDANLNVPLSIFMKCLEYGIRRFFTIGTGLPDEFNLYCFTKRKFSDFGKWYSRGGGNCNGKDGNIEFCNIELENFYGINEPLDRFIPSVIYKMKNNQDIFLTLGTQKRDFIYIDDVVNAIVKLIELEQLPSYIDFPIGTGVSPTIREVIEYLADITNTNSKLKFGAIQKRKNEPDSIADITLMKNYKIDTMYTWKEGLKKLI